MKPYDEYMPTKEKDVLVQVKVLKSKHEKIAAILKKEDWTWHDFVNGLFDKYLDDNSHKRRIG
jgi:hypothetical protein